MIGYLGCIAPSLKSRLPISAWLMKPAVMKSLTDSIRVDGVTGSVEVTAGVVNR